MYVGYIIYVSYVSHMSNFINRLKSLDFLFLKIWNFFVNIKGWKAQTIKRKTLTENT